jgi:exosome complex RNA-binding protein Rrp42 (RNase PH superfamily)
MALYIILIVVIIVSFVTGIVTTILEKKELNEQNKKSFEGQYQERNNNKMSEVLSKTLELSSITQKVDQIKVSDSSSSESDYSQEPVIIAILDEEVK